MQSQGAFNQGPGRGAFNQNSGRGAFSQPSNRGVFNQPVSRGAFNQAFGNPFNTNQGNGSNQPSLASSTNGQNRNNSAFSQPFGGGSGTSFTNQGTGRGGTSFNINSTAGREGCAFNQQATGLPSSTTIGQNRKNTSLSQAFGGQGGSAFGTNQGFGRGDQQSTNLTASANQSTGQNRKNAAFNQAFGRDGSSFSTNQGAGHGDQQPATLVDSSNQMRNTSAFSQPKRGGGRGGQSSNSNSNRGRGRESTIAIPTATSRRGGHAGQAPHAFQRNNVNNNGTRTPNSEMTATSSDTGKKTAADRAIRFGGTSKTALYDQFKESRVRERQQAIEYGLIPDPNNPTRLEDAIDFRGICMTKCPEFEILEREIQNGLDSLEMDSEGNVDPEKAVKAYRRSAAGLDQPLPSDVRPPEVLLKTLDYLFDDILSNNALENCHAFVRDRTRSIRQDFTLQNIRDITAVQVHERIARFHILCLHEMCELDEGRFSKQQETEQLRKVLVSLMEFYDDLREEGIETENEAEFRAYNIISHIRDQDIARQAMTLPVYIFKSPHITRALEFRALSQRNNEIMESSSRRNKPENMEASQNFYSSFFKLIQDSGTPFLMACMLESHFADVRKGALKAMNVSYMIKAGGVQAEDVRQVLGYDTIKQLLEEAQLYGIIIDNSLGEPTLCFGQKHYTAKIPVFIEPLSNPAQRKSLLLVEPKKAGRTFREIVNGINPNATPLPNQNVFARQSNPIAFTGGAFNFVPKQTNTTTFGIPPGNFNSPTINVKFTDLVGEDSESKQNESEEQLEIVRSKAAAAAAMAQRERKKLEALETQKKLEAAKREEAKRLESQRLLEEKRKQEEIIRQQERAKEREEEAKKQLEKRQQQQRERQIAQMHLNVIKSQLANRLTDQILNDIVQKEAKTIVLKSMETKRYIKRITQPWVARARASVAKRVSNAMKRKSQWQFNKSIICNNPYISSNDTIYNSRPIHSTPEGIKDRVNQSILAEKIALENTRAVVDQDSVWKSIDFPLYIYPRINDKIVALKQARLSTCDSTKPSWQLMINAASSEFDSSIWFRRKFELDGSFIRKDCLYQAFNITIRMATPYTEISCQIAEELGAIIFSLPESKADKNQDEFASYWAENKQRLEKLIEDLQYFNPGMQVPFLFTYFPDSSSTESTLEKIPHYLELETKTIISDYHILVMNPLTIPDRIVNEVNWLSNNTIINQE